MTTPAPDDPAETVSDRLLPQHLADLRGSGLSDDQILRCRFRSLSDPADVAKWLRWPERKKAAGLGPCLAFPFYDPAGAFLDYVRLKPDRPRTLKKKAVKYESPVGVANRAYVPPGTRSILADPSVLLLMTEGEKKAAKADQDGFPCVGLVGVYGWQQKRPRDANRRAAGARELIPDLAGIAWAGRTVVIAYDSDVAQKPEVRTAEWHLAATLGAAGATVRAVRFPGGPGGEKVGLDDFLVAHGPDALRVLVAAAEPVTNPNKAPEIVIGTDEHRVNEAAAAALATEPDVYERGGLLVYVRETAAEPDSDEIVRRPVGAPVVRELARPLLRERLTRCAAWKQWRGSGEEATLEDAHPPDWCVQAVHARGAWPDLRRLDAVVTYPVLMPSGAVLTANGYHRGTGLLACLPPDLAIDVPDRPTTADVTAAVATLFDPLADFPFETPAHRAALIAGLLTPLAWFLFEGPAPLFLIDKNVRGAGAGLLADVVALVVTGLRFPVMSYTNDREELRKRITTLAMEGERLVLLDNLAGAVGNDILDAALTADRWKDRILGGNRVYDGPLHVVWFGTGNNVQLHADTSRRVCHIRMESDHEWPEMRDGFRYANLRAHVRSHRGKLLSAALTILRGW
ncbi:DUF3854 domain-containing protein [Fimbriiglobus ruber]|uniref:DUF3854 domain-containing protein n=1 Tax=Fimbriiglobus ruber TaxID=1908690 RepID=A0A225CY74_9BACT|nr:DUF3854 domain-containing protein [Fimbriiglobus ruber]OWK34182.1 hypothetical protein FRUB_10153 [Fimbriiglobus ruber]